ncbi:MAG: SusD/RagB family nutrient-binding outer membrane lipoprotein [Chitinophagaceae bacterium]|nr:SusD/RagB family nutrient-binding outer membrane lipoprotein [Chitinophagaceae bacterium]
MKIIIKNIFIILAVAGFSSCKKYLDINTNPNSPTQPPINGLVTKVTQNAALNVFRVANITSYYTQYLASPNPSSPTDVYEPIDASGTWSLLYDNMTDIYDLQKIAAEQGATQYVGVAKILMAMDLHLLHNLWGAVPYSAAFSAESLAPTFDDAQTIYQKCLGLLDEGIVELQKSGSTRAIPVASGTGVKVDLIHNGESVAWIRTANALKARLLNQLSKTPQYNPASIFNALSSAYTSVAHDAFITAFNIRNPWNQVAVNNAALVLDGWLSEHYVKSMDGSLYGAVDPRLPLTASLTRFNDYRGTRNGKGRVGSGTNKDESYISLTGFYSGTNSPLFIITYEEMKFIEAEVAFRTNDKARAYAAYLTGIRENMNKMGVAPAARDAYVNAPTVSVGAAALTLELIFREKYKALFLMPVTWDDARRFDYKYQGFLLPLNAVKPTFVRRLVYPSVETSRNGANVPAVSDVTQKLWWDMP